MIKNKIVLASANEGKVREFNRLLAACGYEVIPQTELGIESVEETGLSFVENAILKARHAAKESGMPALADDSGIEVDALQGRPGIYSARYAGVNASDEDNNQKLLRELNGKAESERSARYQCVLAFMRHGLDPSPLIVQAHWEGLILDAPRGINGFGYDPLFWVPTHNCSSAELEPGEKNRISHRALAMQKLLAEIANGDFEQGQACQS